MLETCLALRRRLGNPVDIAATLSTLALARLSIGDWASARESESEALEIFRSLTDRFGEAIGRLHLGQIEMYVDDDARAKLHLEACLSLAREIKNQEVEGECERLLGEIAYEAGDLAHARQWLTRSLTVCREAGDKRGDAMAQWWLGRVDLSAAQLEPARARLDTALQAFRAFKMQEELLGCLEDHAALVGQEGDLVRAVRLLASATVSRARLGSGRGPARGTATPGPAGRAAAGAARRRLYRGVERRTRRRARCGDPSGDRGRVATRCRPASPEPRRDGSGRRGRSGGLRGGRRGAASRTMQHPRPAM